MGSVNCKTFQSTTTSEDNIGNFILFVKYRVCESEIVRNPEN